MSIASNKFGTFFVLPGSTPDSVIHSGHTRVSFWWIPPIQTHQTIQSWELDQDEINVRINQETLVMIERL